MKAIRVLIFDDNNDRRDSLSMLIMASNGMELTGAHPDCSNVVNVVSKAQPDVVLMDIEMPGINGIAATGLIKMAFPDVAVLIQTVFEDPDRIFESITAGASGYLVKSTPAEKIIEAIKEVNAGGSSLSPAVAAKVLAYFRPANSPTPVIKEYNLSDRELEVLNHLVKGLSYKIIADKMSISYHTVNTHIRKIYEKLQVHSAGEAVSKAMQHRLVG